MKINEVKPTFVDTIPKYLEEGILYIAPQYNAIVHKCACGCGEIVSTPTDEYGWTLLYKDSEVSLHPSIGNYYYKCKSHYYIKKNKIIWLQQEKSIQRPNHTDKKWWNKLLSKFIKKKQN